jgi:SAM-dependent methyltransferase
MLDQCGFKINGARVGELGPGNSIGLGLAALISGAASYVGLDIVHFTAKVDLEKMFEELYQMYRKKDPIPNDIEFPSVRPRIDSYEFPSHLIDWTDFHRATDKIRQQVRNGVNNGSLLSYRVPWTSQCDIDEASLDLIFSQAVLEHVDRLEETYRAMFAWLKPGGYTSHVIDFRAHGRSPFWNGHWAYADWHWYLVRGRREYLLNREPLSTHLDLAKKVGFEVVLVKREIDGTGLGSKRLSSRFRGLDYEDIRTCGALLVLRKGMRSSESR